MYIYILWEIFCYDHPSEKIHSEDFRSPFTNKGDLPLRERLLEGFLDDYRWSESWLQQWSTVIFLLWAVSFALRGFGDATICDNTKATKNPQQRLMKWGIYGIPLDMGWCGGHKNDPFLMHFRKSICRFQGLNCLLQGGTGLVYQGNFSYAFLVISKAFWDWCIQKHLYIFKCIIDVVGIYLYRVHNRQSLHIRHLDFLVGRCCPMGVFDVEDVPQGKRAVVVNERNCTTCRECLETFNGQALSERDSGFA